MRRGICTTCKTPVTETIELGWRHDHANLPCAGHQADKPWAFNCGSVCDFPHSVVVAEVTFA